MVFAVISLHIGVTFNGNRNAFQLGDGKCAVHRRNLIVLVAFILCHGNRDRIISDILSGFTAQAVNRCNTVIRSSGYRRSEFRIRGRIIIIYLGLATRGNGDLRGINLKRTVFTRYGVVLDFFGSKQINDDSILAGILPFLTVDTVRDIVALDQAFHRNGKLGIGRFIIVISLGLIIRLNGDCSRRNLEYTGCAVIKYIVVNLID